VVFSSEALLAGIVVGLTTIAVPLCLGFFRLPSNSIIVGSNSAAISAQCHPGESRRGGAGVETIEREEAEEANIAGADREEGEDGHEIRDIHRFDNNPENGLWLQRMQWGVLVRGGDVPEEAGQLGLGSVKSIVGRPTTSFYS